MCKYAIAATTYAHACLWVHTTSKYLTSMPPLASWAATDLDVKGWVKSSNKDRNVLKLMASLCPCVSFTDSCNGPLLSALPHSSFQSSTQSSASYAAHNAKLNRRDGEYKRGCFCKASIFPTCFRHLSATQAYSITCDPYVLWLFYKTITIRYVVLLHLTYVAVLSWSRRETYIMVESIINPKLSTLGTYWLTTCI